MSNGENRNRGNAGCNRQSSDEVSSRNKNYQPKTVILKTPTAEELADDEYAKQVISVKASQLSCRSDFPRGERDDIEQELWIHLITQLDKFDP